MHSIKQSKLEPMSPKEVCIDKEYAQALSQTLSEWDSKEDNNAFQDLQRCNPY